VRNNPLVFIVFQRALDLSTSPIPLSVDLGIAETTQYKPTYENSTRQKTFSSARYWRLRIDSNAKL
jgi:hypothetical protein